MRPRLAQHTLNEGYMQDGVVIVLICLNSHRTFYKQCRFVTLLFDRHFQPAWTRSEQRQAKHRGTCMTEYVPVVYCLQWVVWYIRWSFPGNNYIFTFARVLASCWWSRCCHQYPVVEGFSQQVYRWDGIALYHQHTMSCCHQTVVNLWCRWYKWWKKWSKHWALSHSRWQQVRYIRGQAICTDILSAWAKIICNPS